MGKYIQICKNCVQFIWRNLRDLLLPGEVLGVLDGRDHLVDGEEGGEVGGVGGDDDQGEEPPDGAHYPRAGSLRVQTRPLQTSTISTIYNLSNRALNESLRSFQNHGEGSYNDAIKKLC